MAQNQGAGAKPSAPAAQLVAQGKKLYLAQQFKPALAKFEAALKLEPQNDEALSLAAVTAFRLDLQAQSRDYFIRRANLAGQKDSVKAFSFYRAALTYWREVHDLVAKFVEIKENKVTTPIPDQDRAEIQTGIKNGLETPTRPSLSWTISPKPRTSGICCMPKPRCQRSLRKRPARIADNPSNL
jgi:tetratricopeptide (TPR) repeat protein